VKKPPRLKGDSGSKRVRVLCVAIVLAACVCLGLTAFEDEVWFADGYSLRGWGLFLSFMRQVWSWVSILVFGVLTLAMLRRRRLAIWTVLIVVLGLCGLLVAGTRKVPRDQMLDGMLKRADERLNAAEVLEWAKPALSNPGHAQELQENMPRCVREFFYPPVNWGPYVYEMALGAGGRDGRVIVVHWIQSGLVIGDGNILEALRNEGLNPKLWRAGVFVFSGSG